MFDLISSDLPPSLSTPFSLMENGFRRLSRVVTDMTDAELNYLGPGGNINSTATLIAHLARTDLEYLHRIKGVPVPPDLEAAYGPERTPDETLPTVMVQNVSELLERYQRVIAMTRAYLSTQSDADALRPVTIPWWSEPATVRFVLWHMAGHSMFHQGQIQRLRACYSLI